MSSCRPCSPRSSSPLGMILCFLVCTLLLFGVFFWLYGQEPSESTAADLPLSEARLTPITCVVIDPGHGGEDGGASSASGVTEKDVNLAVAEALRDLLEAAGIPCVMTRTEDKLLYDRNVDYQGRKKVLDLAARLAVAEASEGCLFVSIHMNAYTDPKESGMQVWYGCADTRSKAIAEAIQSASLSLIPNNRRRVKAAGSNIYLLDRTTCPSILVECGFLSNPAEAERLSDEGYQQEVASVIMGGILPFFGEKVE